METFGEETVLATEILSWTISARETVLTTRTITVSVGHGSIFSGDNVGTENNVEPGDVAGERGNVGEGTMLAVNNVGEGENAGEGNDVDHRTAPRKQCW
jgi:hypothetical protein